MAPSRELDDADKPNGAEQDRGVECEMHSRILPHFR